MGSTLRSPMFGKHRGKEANKFQFDIFVDRLYGGSAADYTIKWSRGVKAASTKHVFGDPKNNDGVLIAQKLSLLSTLYRPKGSDGGTFDAKPSKLTLIAHKDGLRGEKPVGKAHFDLSQFVGIPCATSTQTFVLNPKTRVEVTITCTFVRVSRGSVSSMGSGLSGMTGSSGEAEQGNSDFADMEISPIHSPLSALGIGPPANKDLARALSGKDEKAGQDVNQGGRDQRELEATSQEKDIPPTARRVASKPKSEKEGFSPRSSGILAFKNKAKVAALENEVEELRFKLEDSIREKEKSRVLIQISEDVIRELREKIENANRSPRAESHPSRKDLQEQVDRLERELATCSIEMQRESTLHESRVETLRQQVDATERSSKRLEKENITLRDQVNALSNFVDSTREQEEREGRSREQLLHEVTQLQADNQELGKRVSERSARVRVLEEDNKEMERKINFFTAKLTAHEDHAKRVRATFDELSSMYNALREDHAKLTKQSGSNMKAEFEERPSDESTQTARNGQALNDGVQENEPQEREILIEGTKSQYDHIASGEELQRARRHIVEVGRALTQEKCTCTNLKAELEAKNARGMELEKENTRLEERLGASKSKVTILAEELEMSRMVIQEHKADIDSLQADIESLREKLIQKEQDHLMPDATAQQQEEPKASRSSVLERNTELEQALADSSEREEKYEEEIVKLTRIVDDLADKVSSKKDEIVDFVSGRDREREEEMRPRQSPLDALLDEQINCNNVALSGEQTSKPRACDCHVQKSSSTLSRRKSSGLKRMFSKRSASRRNSDDFISSSRVREADLFEKITDGRLLSMLVETKMKLAVSEEEKLALEHLIRTTRDGDRHVQNKIAEHASRLEVKLSQADLLISRLQQDQETQSGTVSTGSAEGPSSRGSKVRRQITRRNTRTHAERGSESPLSMRSQRSSNSMSFRTHDISQASVSDDCEADLKLGLTDDYDSNLQNDVGDNNLDLGDAFKVTIGE